VISLLLLPPILSFLLLLLLLLLLGAETVVARNPILLPTCLVRYFLLVLSAIWLLGGVSLRTGDERLATREARVLRPSLREHLKRCEEER
jgi:hypothetical protein